MCVYHNVWLHIGIASSLRLADGRTRERKDGRKYGRKDGRTDRRTDGRMGGLTE